MDVRALKDQANAHFAKGRFARCVNVYAQLIRMEAHDPQLRLRHAEACRRINENKLAIESYKVAAKLLSEAGHLARALAALRLAFGLAPDDSSIHALIAEVGVKKSNAPAAPALQPLPPPPPQPAGRPRAISLEEIPLVAPMEIPAPKVRVAAARERPATFDGPKVKRLSDRTLAFKPTPSARWVIISSQAPIDVSFAEDGELARGAGTAPKPLSRTTTTEFLTAGAEASGEFLTEQEFELMYVTGDIVE